MRGHHLIALVPRAVADLTHMCHLGDLARECPPCYTLLTAQNGEPYFTVLGRTQRDYEHAKEVLLHIWPQIPERILLWGDLQWGLQPALFVKPRPSFPDGDEAWVEEDRRMLSLWMEQLVRLISSPASRDILGAPDHRGRRQRLASKAMSAHHCERCPTCRQAQTFEELCPQARAYACEHETPLLGRLSGDMDSFDARKARRDG
jgi:hypothetical protein